MKSVEEKVREKLFEMQDKQYREFHSKLIPNVSSECIIGVRTPLLRAFAKQFAKTDEAIEFINILPHKYYEENNLHGFIIETFKDYDKVISSLDSFLPYVDNWATCDMISLGIFKKRPPKLYDKIKLWISSNLTYTVRFGLGMLMKFYLDGDMAGEALDLAANIRSDEYYINMMIAWFFATALSKQYEVSLPYLQERRLSEWTHNKTIQKASESSRITNEQKKYLATLKIKV